MACRPGCIDCGPCVQLTERTTIGDYSLPRVITLVSDIDGLKGRLDPDFRATDTSVQACEHKLDPYEVQAWRDFYEAWRDYADTSTQQQVYCPDLVTRFSGAGCIGAGTVYEDGLEREKQLAKWQQKLAGKGCQGDAPWIDDPAKRAPDMSWVKWIAGAVAVVGIAYTAGPFLRGVAKGVFK
jgi:hypothetical protein